MIFLIDEYFQPESSFVGKVSEMRFSTTKKLTCYQLIYWYSSKRTTSAGETCVSFIERPNGRTE